MSAIALQGMTSVELGKMTKAAIIAALVGDQTVTECTQSIDSPAGQVAREYVTKDPAGSLLQTERWDWKYNKRGEITEILHTILDSKAAVMVAEKILHTDTTELKELAALQAVEAMK
jgi:hypothetical protein